MLSRCVPLVSRPNGVSSPSEDLRLIFQDDRRIFNQQNLHNYPLPTAASSFAWKGRRCVTSVHGQFCYREAVSIVAKSPLHCAGFAFVAGMAARGHGEGIHHSQLSALALFLWLLAGAASVAV